jgi:AcrR family transcriptional regulator
MNQSTPKPDIKRRPGGRTEAVRKKVADSVIELLRKGSINFSYNELAELSGINKTTLYRRWPSQIDLLQEALREHNRIEVIKRQHDWPSTLDKALRQMASHLVKPEEIALNLSYISAPEVDESRMVFEHWHPVQQNFISLIEDAQQRGELRADLNPVSIFAVMISSLAILSLIERKPLEADRLDGIIKVLQTTAVQAADTASLTAGTPTATGK